MSRALVLSKVANFSLTCLFVLIISQTAGLVWLSFSSTSFRVMIFLACSSTLPSMLSPTTAMVPAPTECCLTLAMFLLYCVRLL